MHAYHVCVCVCVYVLYVCILYVCTREREREWESGRACHGVTKRVGVVIELPRLGQIGEYEKYVSHLMQFDTAIMRTG